MRSHQQHIISTVTHTKFFESELAQLAKHQNYHNVRQLLRFGIPTAKQQAPTIQDIEYFNFNLHESATETKQHRHVQFSNFT
jgi:hypothetical protein